MFNKLHPLIITDKLTDTTEFYKTHFEFDETFTSDWYVQLLHANGTEIAVMVSNAANQPDFLHAPHGGSGMVMTFEVDDATATYETFKSKGVTFLKELTDEEWGQRHFILQDPAGVYVDVVQYL